MPASGADGHGLKARAYFGANRNAPSSRMIGQPMRTSHCLSVAPLVTSYHSASRLQSSSGYHADSSTVLKPRHLENNDRQHPGNLSEIGEQVTERQDVSKDTHPTPTNKHTWPTGELTAVSSAPEDVAGTGRRALAHLRG